MHRFTILAVLSVFVLSVPAAQLSSREVLKKLQTGEATYYYPQPDAGVTATGACGWVNQNTDLVVAVSADTFNGGQACGSWFTVTNEDNGESVTVEVVDYCPACNDNHLDLSIGAFSQIEPDPTDVEVLYNVEWN